jgi:transcriptional regulator with XRE-family HTH domain
VIDLKTLGTNIRTERKRQLLTIERLSEMASITENFLGKIERGEGTPSLSTIDSISCALGVGIDRLLNALTPTAEHNFISSLVEINELTKENKEKFFDFITTNIKYFKD